ncbi:MAG: hypothetical protein OHK93_008673 [Ramalina farinacea]|uniref:Initiation-specific alpha-1,6-mannosyltransferase n=1 Tax=Ramalina farinacea TaxID=258253 RepID=A0AA43QS60_9LECA|nr:hypothetical protein [Ramalina farinacea]
MGLRIPTILRIFVGFCTLLVALSYWRWLHSPSSTPAQLDTLSAANVSQATDGPAANPHEWNKVVWQTSKLPLDDLPDDEWEKSKSWERKNKGYRHELMTDERMEEYVRHNFMDTEAGKVYFEVQDYILRSDLIRYFIMLQDGGVYNDLDVGCEKPIKQWMPPQFENDAGVLLGVEVDNKYGPDGRTWTGGEDLFEFVNWTIMARPQQPFIRFLVDRVTGNLRRMAERLNSTLAEMQYSVQDVLNTTGPTAMTYAFYDYASNLTGTSVTYKNFTKIIEPKIIGEVVILPIHAFGAGHQVEWAGFEQDESKVLVHHYFRGSWKEDHFMAPTPELKQEEEAAMEEDDVHREEKTADISAHSLDATVLSAETTEVGVSQQETESSHSSYLEPQIESLTSSSFEASTMTAVRGMNGRPW